MEEVKKEVNAIKVVMLGSSRAGKTAILASMLHNIREKCKDYFSVTDKSAEQYERLEPEKRKKVILKYSIAEMTDMLNPLCERGKKGKGNIFLGGLLGSIDSFTYRLCVQSKKDNSLDTERLYIEITDIPGEVFNSAAIAYDALLEKVQNAQILIVAIDTPILMWVEKNSSEILNTAFNRIREVVESIENLGQKLQNPDRMIVFVPVKCEYWAHKNKINDVYKIILDTYKPCIDVIEKYNNVQSMIVPMETIGSVLFHHISENPKLLKYGEVSEDHFVEEKGYTRCEEMPNKKLVRLPNGAIYKVSVSDALTSTEERKEYPYCIDGEIIPYMWYYKDKDIEEYLPKHCDQLFYQILKFSINSLYNQYLIETKKPSIGMWDYIFSSEKRKEWKKEKKEWKEWCEKQSIWSKVNVEQYLQNIETMEKSGIINDSVFKWIVNKKNGKIIYNLNNT
jgi:GTPase SAR1 family protein